MVALSLAALLVAPQPQEGQRLVERVKDSVFTVEVHSGTSDAKDVLGSGYLVSAQGLIVTNYHVVSAFVDDPKRYQVRVKGARGTHPAKLRTFDLVNDLALLEIEPLPAAPLTLASGDPARGESIVSLGNPEGLGLSLIEGVFNGYAEKGFVDRLLLSMPLNSGMSGGPILNRSGEVVGTNVSVIWLANSLSFGVPAAKVRALLSAPAVATDEKGLRDEITRQLLALEQQTAARVVAPFVQAKDEAPVSVGALRLLRPPEPFDCWNASEVFKDEGVTKLRYGCNLQFTPAVEKLGEVGSVELQVDHFASRGGSFGFYGALGAQAAGDNGISARDPSNGVLSAPECAVERVRSAHLDWKVNTCTSALVKHPGLFNFDLVATTLSQPRHGACLTLRAKGLKLESFLRLARVILDTARLGATP
jgi:serine protease Do